MKKEIWKEVVGFEDSYCVSNNGKVKSLSRFVKHNENRLIKTKERILKNLSMSSGYTFVQLRKNNKTKCLSVHRLVAMAFINNPKNKPQVNHINGNKKDNNVENLEWCTQGENNAHAYRNGLKKHHACWKGKSGSLHNKSIPVSVYNESGEKIFYFGSAREASRKLKVHDVSSKCHKNKFYNGMKFMFDKKIENE